MTEEKENKEKAKDAEKPKKETKVQKISQAEFEKKVVELAKKDLTSEKIGEELRKQNIHSNDFAKTISQILKEKDLYVDPDLKNVEEKLERINAHYDKNHQDKRAMREKDRIFAQLRKLKIYNKIETK
jgi:ribosomal protein S15P/S13E